MAFYMLSLHIPLSFGGISVVSQILQEPNLDPQTEVSISLDFFDKFLLKLHSFRISDSWVNVRQSKKMVKRFIGVFFPYVSI